MAAGGASKANESTEKGGVQGETDDPEVIIARRNAEHRRMQASSNFQSINKPPYSTHDEYRKSTAVVVVLALSGSTTHAACHTEPQGTATTAENKHNLEQKN